MKYNERIALDLAADIQCGVALARDLLRLAGGNAQIVRDASAECQGVESMKAYIIDRRVARIEEHAEEIEERVDLHYLS